MWDFLNYHSVTRHGHKSIAQALEATKSSVPALYETILGCRNTTIPGGKIVAYFYAHLSEIDVEDANALKCINLRSDPVITAWKDGLKKQFNLNDQQVEVTSKL